MSAATTPAASASRGPFAGHFTAGQESALIALLGDLDRLHPRCRLLGHRDLAATLCPGFDVGAWLGAIGAGA
jgi:N-acetyl-anhydromuramyl-L-alanine amidase AmpD